MLLNDISDGQLFSYGACSVVQSSDGLLSFRSILIDTLMLY